MTWRAVSMLTVSISIVVLAGAAVAVHAEEVSEESVALGQGGVFLTDVLARIDPHQSMEELGDASVIIEVNSTDGDAGFQVFLDGDGWRMARVFDPFGTQVLNVHVGGGVRSIGGGTELFMETEEPEYESLEEFEELIANLPEGEYTILAATTEQGWAIGTADFTHDVPAGPVVVAPVPDPGEECAADILADFALIEWDAVTSDLSGEGEIEIVGYQVIVEHEESERSLMVELRAETTVVSIPPEFLEAGQEYKFEILAIEESGNQTITESCFETAE